MKRYRLTESRLRGMIREAVNGALNDGDDEIYYHNDYRSSEFRQSGSIFVVAVDEHPIGAFKTMDDAVRFTAERVNSLSDVADGDYRDTDEIVDVIKQQGGSSYDKRWGSFYFKFRKKAFSCENIPYLTR